MGLCYAGFWEVCVFGLEFLPAPLPCRSSLTLPRPGVIFKQSQLVVRGRCFDKIASRRLSRRGCLEEAVASRVCRVNGSRECLGKPASPRVGPGGVSVRTAHRYRPGLVPAVPPGRHGGWLPIIRRGVNYYYRRCTTLGTLRMGQTQQKVGGQTG